MKVTRLFSAIALTMITALLFVMLLSPAAPARADDDQPPPRTRANSPEAFVTIYVDRSDDANVTACSAAANDCTLRGAINKANGDLANIYTIYFSPIVTAVNVAAALPTITANDTWIYGINGVPRIDALNMTTGDVFTINADRARIAGLSIVNGNEADEFANIKIGGGTRIEIENNYLGTLPGATSCATSGVTRNAFIGVWIDSGVSGSSGAGNGAVYVYGNTIGCHGIVGIGLLGADYVRIGERPDGAASANYIGVSASGITLTNAFDGVSLATTAGNAPRNNLIANNVIAGNGVSGIIIIGSGTPNSNSAYNNVIRANRIGVGPTGTPVINGEYGVYIGNGAFQNFIGGAADADRNIISGNTGYGVFITDSVGIGVLGNYIGTNVSGTAALGNGSVGVLIGGGSANIVGGAIYGIFPAVKGNRIQYNGGRGVQLSSGTHTNQVLANDIRYNAGSGVGIDSGAYDNLVGGSVITSQNVIRENGGYGVILRDNTTTGNVVKYNNIEYNSLDGILIDDDAHDNQIGGDGPSDYNLINANGGSGIWINSSGPNWVSYNYISLNAHYGVLLDIGTQGARITNTTIAQNGYDGIGVRGTAPLLDLNRWSNVSIYDNAGLGIDRFVISDTANIVNAPFAKITSISTAGGSTTLTGTGQNGSVVEVYGVAPDPSGFGEGKTYLGTDTVSSGQWTLSVPSSAASCFTLFESLLGTSSEFGPSSCRTFLPTVLK